MTACRALLFDLDGTLIDSRRDIAAACNAMLAHHGHASLTEDDVMPMIGDGARALVARALRRSGLAPERASDTLIDERVASFKRFYVERPCVHTTLMPGAREALALDLPSAIVTNKPREVTEVVLAALAIDVQALWAGDGALKPAPDGVLVAAKALFVDPGDAWMIGDGPQDVLAAKAAGAFAVAVPGIADAAHVRAAKPDLALGSLTELGAALQRFATST